MSCNSLPVSLAIDEPVTAASPPCIGAHLSALCVMWASPGCSLLANMFNPFQVFLLRQRVLSFGSSSQPASFAHPAECATSISGC